jgi:hypothetical protein
MSRLCYLSDRSRQNLDIQFAVPGRVCLFVKEDERAVLSLALVAHCLVGQNPMLGRGMLIPKANSHSGGDLTRASVVIPVTSYWL